MDAAHFDALVRTWGIGSRRDGLRWLAAGVLGGALTLRKAGETASKRKRKKKKKKRCAVGSRPCAGGCISSGVCCTDSDCGAGGACANGTCLCLSGYKLCQGVCIPKAFCCCTSGQTCLANGSCATACLAGNGPCPNGHANCECLSNQSVEGPRYCTGFTDCAGLPECASTEECQDGQYCQVTGCPAPQNRCVPLC
jgi:hypothetical protein